MTEIKLDRNELYGEIQKEIGNLQEINRMLMKEAIEAGKDSLWIARNYRKNRRALGETGCILNNMVRDIV